METEFVVSEKLGGKVTCQRRLSIAGSLIFFQEYGKGGLMIQSGMWGRGEYHTWSMVLLKVGKTRGVLLELLG
ncbi:hypothetical protein JTE90_015351 [Oedothorax gibbosus]|uniref:Uncharacterized protein n=1 Tax=Oedothorax gibbosus TaxID=931172 RepID=A0AAV6TIS6_9ARAC|nr:hypothetical protein JTE90_015351 [Oedothorax gibbosus]